MKIGTGTRLVFPLIFQTLSLDSACRALMRKIISTININSGSPRIDGTRLTCANVVQSLWYGYEFSLNAYLATYEYLSREEVLNCLAYCVRQQCVADNVYSYCQQCSLDKRPLDPRLAQEYDEFMADEMDNDREDVWRLAKKLLIKYSDASDSSEK